MLAGRQVFPLVPRRRLVGLAFGGIQSARRGRGSDVAGSRTYQPGDPVEQIDWKATARLATAQGRDDFILRERHAEEAPRVLVVCDRRPNMAIFPDSYPWLSKPRALEATVDLIAESTAAAHGLLGYLDYADFREEPYWRGPRSQSTLWEVHDRVALAPFDAPVDNLTHALEYLGQIRRELPPGSFVFVLSDFLESPDAAAWERAAGRGWELVPVIVQDPVWEQDFPDVAAVVTPLVDPGSGRVSAVRLSDDEVRARREANRSRLAELVREFERLGMTPLVVSTSDREEIFREFVDWADRRVAERARVW